MHERGVEIPVVRAADVQRHVHIRDNGGGDPAESPRIGPAAGVSLGHLTVTGKAGAPSIGVGGGGGGSRVRGDREAGDEVIGRRGTDNGSKRPRVRGDGEAEGERRSTRKVQPTKGSVDYFMQWRLFQNRSSRREEALIF